MSQADATSNSCGSDGEHRQVDDLGDLAQADHPDLEHAHLRRDRHSGRRRGAARSSRRSAR